MNYLLQQARTYLPQAIPSLTLFVSIALTTTILPDLIDHSPAFILISLFTWLLYRPNLVFPGFVVLLGLFQDVVANYTLGFSALIYLSVYWIVITQRQHLIKESFYVVWFGFTTLTCLVHLLYWLLAMAFTWHYFSPSSLFYTCLLTIFFYPLFARMLLVLHQWIGEIE